MDFNEYKKLAMRTKKPWDDKSLEMAYCALGLTGEAGEVAEMIKKHLSGSKPIDIEKLKKELGDVLWYIACSADYFDLDMDEIAQINIDKLHARHGESWSGYGNRTGQGE